MLLKAPVTLCVLITTLALCVSATAAAQPAPAPPCLEGFRHVPASALAEGDARRKLTAATLAEDHLCLRLAAPRLLQTSTATKPWLECPDLHLLVPLATIRLDQLGKPARPPHVLTPDGAMTCAASTLPDPATAGQRWDPPASTTHRARHMTVIWTGADFYDGDLLRLTVEKLSECRAACEDRARCMFFTYESDRKRCRLKPWPLRTRARDTEAGLKLRRADPLTDAWIAPPHGLGLFKTRAVGCPKPAALKKLPVATPSITFAHVHDPATCASVCASTGGCKAFIWAPDAAHPEGGRCHTLKAPVTVSGKGCTLGTRK